MKDIFADKILYNGLIVSIDDKKSTFEAIALKDGKILALGNEKYISGYKGINTEIINLEGKTVLPGFIDAHQHIFNTGFNLLNINCGFSTSAEVLDAVKKRVNESKPNDWIIGWGYNESNFSDDNPLSQKDLNDIENPVYIGRYCLHEAVLNEKALKLAGITENTYVEGGLIEKDQQGRLTGVIKEKALDLVKNVMPPYTEKMLEDMALIADREYVKKGITSVHEAGLGFFTGTLVEFKVLQQLYANKKINVRTYAMILTDFFEHLNAIKLQGNFGNDGLKVGSVKLFCDGSMGGQTAAVSVKYLHSEDNYGIYKYSDDELEKKILEAHKAGYQVAVHAMGDVAIEKVLSIFESALQMYPRRDHRHRIEHAAITNEKIIQKMKSLGVIPVPQYGLVYEMGDTYMKILDKPIYDHVFASKSFYDAGLKPAGSSDSPVVNFSPLEGIYAAMSRETKSKSVYLPEQRLSLYEAVETYTVFAAFSAFDENIKGTLEVGKLADLVVLPANFMEFSAEEVKNTEVEMTMINGEVVYQRERKFQHG
ncbi:amidohydrolase [Niallia sp. Krafla_26]|uniref:amidohydrolase n=1 Tax=Niallia sp. Krafla_26 TaxID=3064703 RepID=UPI003D1641F9